MLAFLLLIGLIALGLGYAWYDNQRAELEADPFRGAGRASEARKAQLSVQSFATYEREGCPAPYESLQAVYDATTQYTPIVEAFSLAEQGFGRRGNPWTLIWGYRVFRKLSVNEGALSDAQLARLSHEIRELSSLEAVSPDDADFVRRVLETAR